MQLCTAQSFCSLQIIPRHSNKLPRCKGSNSLMLEKMSFSKAKHSIRPKLKHVLPLSRLIVFPSSTGLPGIRNHLSQESNYCERGVLVWIARVELLSFVEGSLDCQHRLLLNCQNSHQARVEASSCVRYILIFQMLWHPQTHTPWRPCVTYNPYFILTGHLTWNMRLWKATD